MLKHTSNATGGPMNGQLRNAPSGISQQRPNNNILRPQHPLNVSSFSTTSSIPGPMCTINNSNGVTNCAERLSASGLLDMSSTSTCNVHQPVYITNPNTITRVSSISPVNGRAVNSIGNHLHTYCNQNITAANNINPVANILQTNNNNPQHNNTNINEPSYSNCNKISGEFINQSKHGPAPQEALTSLGLLCLVSLLLAMLSLIFLLKISPNGREEAILRSPNDDFVVIYDITLALCALSLSLNLCCLLVCAIQFLFAVKLVRSSILDKENKYLEKSRISRTCAIGGFFISIPIFLTGIILYTFNQFHSTPAIITSILIGIGIVFCGGAMVHNVFIWQKEKTICYKSASESQKACASQIGSNSKSPIHFLSTNNLINFNAANSTISPTQNTTANTPLTTTNLSSHAGFNAINPNTQTLPNGTLLMRPSTATPPTPKPTINSGSTLPMGCETSRSVTPGIIPTLDISNITTIPAHELSTLV